MTIYSRAADIAKDIAARIAAIRIADGCETDIGARVYRGRRSIDETLVPCAVVIEGPDTPDNQRPGRSPAVKLTQRYVIAGYVQCDPENPNDAAHAAIRDIKRAIFNGDATFGGRVVEVEYRGRDIGPRADGKPIVYVQVDIDVRYVEDLTDP